jgi:hypothetical protein
MPVVKAIEIRQHVIDYRHDCERGERRGERTRRHIANMLEAIAPTKLPTKNDASIVR